MEDQSHWIKIFKSLSDFTPKKIYKNDARKEKVKKFDFCTIKN